MSGVSRYSLGWAVALGASVVLAALAVLAPVVGGSTGGVIHHAFGALCHQIPERSPHLAGGPIALCHRCSGILGGLIVGLALVPLATTEVRQRVASGAQIGWLAAAVLPTALDWALGASGLWANTPLSRSLTGALFGVAAGVILGANLLTVRSRAPFSPTLVS